MEDFKSPLERVSWVAKEILNEKPVTTYDKIARGVFPEGVVVRLGPRCIRFHRAKLLAWLENGGTTAGNGTSHGNESQAA